MKIAFIGTGNMGSACAKAARAALPQAELLLANRTKAKAAALAAELGARVTDNRRAAEEAEFLVLGVKPQMLETLAEEIGDVTAGRENLVLVSMAAGVTVERLNALFGKRLPVIRMMPNLPVTVGKGMTLWCVNSYVTEVEKQVFCSMFSKSGVRAAGAADRCRKRALRLRTGVCLPVPGSHGGRRRTVWADKVTGNGVRGVHHDGNRCTPDGNGETPG